VTTPPSAGISAAGTRLSICLATRNRRAFIGETLDGILAQLVPGVEVIVVDGASTDGTATLLAAYASRHSALRCHLEQTNSGVDGDYDKAVLYASGRHCWLMTDDDVLTPGAVDRVLSCLDEDPELLVVDSEVRTADLGELLAPRRLRFSGERRYGRGDGDRLLEDLGDALSFIGCVVVKRDVWMARDRARFYGSLFVHVGVLFQAPLDSVRALGEPLIRIRYGNAGWSARAFEIWTFKWPGLVWSFPGFSDGAKARVCSREPWRSWFTLALYRGLGVYDATAWKRHLPSAAGMGYRALAWLIAVTPGRLANAALALWILVRIPSNVTLYDLLLSRHATAVTRWAARRRGLRPPLPD
jgi:glycosyltransferase involved in cell wall biosynthesis